ncbi:hypothetical protein DVH05_009203 [Phytophthora capsici]|nr:hypothetical protein DVH05_009203 [Phytophthora capsici]|eukprot:jgi/Phyca11/96567/e_gw1.1.1782.1
MYSKTLLCTHGQPYEAKGSGKRRHNRIRDTKCKARVNVCVAVSLLGEWYLRANATGEHNHGMNKRTFDNYAENRTVKDSRLEHDVAALHKAGSKAQGILRYLREQTGMDVVALRDVHNMVQRQKEAEHQGLTDAQRAFAVLGEFARQDAGNSAQILVDSESKVARIATFQTSRMKRLS